MMGILAAIARRIHEELSLEAGKTALLCLRLVALWCLAELSRKGGWGGVR